MNVLYLLYDGLTDSLGRSQVLPYLLGLRERGHTFTIVSFEKRQRYLKDKHAIEKLVQKAGIRWVPLIYTSSPPILSTVYDVLRLRRAAEALHRETPFDLVHCRSYITALVGQGMKRRNATRFVFDMRAFYADERVDGGLWNLKNPLYRAVYSFFKRKETEFLTEADHSISLTAKGKQIIHSWKQLPEQPVPVEVIPCCADLDHFHPSKIDPERKHELKHRFGLTDDHLVITYLGSIGTWYMLNEMLDFFNQLLKHRPNARFLFITTDNPDHIRNRAHQKGIAADHIIIAAAKREEVPTFLSLAQAAIFFIQPVFSKSGSSPTKHGEMLGMGLPVIANSGVGDVDTIINDTESGILINDFTPQEYEKAVAQFDRLLSIPKERLQAAARRYYSLEEGVKRYHEVYSRIAANDGTSRSARS